MKMRNLLAVAAALLVSACGAEYDKMEITRAQIAANGEAVVGKLKDGREIRMVAPDNGFGDRVYYIDAAMVSAVENCGKSCQKTITTTTVTTKQVITPGMQDAPVLSQGTAQ